MVIKKYIPSQIEPKWQKKWQEDALYLVDLSKAEDSFYMLAELAYTSGDLHMGHWFTFSGADFIARFKRMQGYNVVFPNGFDAFGLPAENAAIKRGIHPSDWTYSNAEKMRVQFDTMGASFDWTKTAISCDPKYYKWNQWIFLKMMEKGIAYRGKALASWCPNCQTVLAEENVEAGKCWRCSSEVLQKEVSQWFFKITAYADQLIWPETPSVDWPKALRVAQNDWIGKSEGMLINFESEAGVIEVFTTRPDTLFGATFLVLSPEHQLLDQLTASSQKEQVLKYAAEAKKKTEVERKENKQKSGVFTGNYITNPLNNEQIPVWVADYVLPGYGTGAIMAVPAHDQRDFEFAKKFNLPIKQVIVRGPAGSQSRRWSSSPSPLTHAFEDEGVMINSGEYNGLGSAEAREKISDYIQKHNLGQRKVNYHLHDWSISRQRYWGTPIPVVYCDKCGTVPVPEKNLPVELPYKVDFTPQGMPPLATAEDWVNVKCPKCGGPARREVETMDGFMDNSWYFYRYLDHENDKEIFDKEIIKNWMPVDIYIGGAEHTYGHALYSRFFTKFFKDLGLVEFDEYAKKRVHHGVILGPDGSRMSKSKGNVVNPDQQVKQYGADAIRLYLAFMGPYDIVAPWNSAGVNGVYHFLQRIWSLFNKVDEKALATPKDLLVMHKTIKKVGEEIEAIKFNTVIAALMEWLNYLSRKEKVLKEEYKTFLLLLSPFAPHITEEVWSVLGLKYSVHQQSWPKFDNKYLEEEEVVVVVQVNGRVRDTLMISKDIVSDSEVVEKMAKESQKVQKFLEGKDVKKSVYIPGKVLSLVV